MLLNRHYSDFLLATTTKERKISRLVIPSGIFALKKVSFIGCLAKIPRYATE